MFGTVSSVVLASLCVYQQFSIKPLILDDKLGMSNTGCLSCSDEPKLNKMFKK